MRLEKYGNGKVGQATLITSIMFQGNQALLWEQAAAVGSSSSCHKVVSVILTTTIPDRHTDAGSQIHSCKLCDKGVDITFVAVRGQRDPNASSTCTADNILTTESLRNCLYVFAGLAQ